MIKQAQYARTTAEAVALLLKNDIDVWWTYDVIKDRIDELGIEGEDLDNFVYMKSLVRMVRDAVIDGADLVERISEGEADWVALFGESPEVKAKREAGNATRLQANRGILAPYLGKLRAPSR